MGIGVGIRRGVVGGVVAVGMCVGGWGQASTTVTVGAGPLLPASFGEWKAAGADARGPYAVSLATLNKAALEEDAPQRSEVHGYQSMDGLLRVEAIEFADRTGAFSAFTLAHQAGMRDGHEVGMVDAVGNGVVLIQQGATLVLAQPVRLTGVGTKDEAELSDLRGLVKLLPKAMGNRGAAPLLPTLVLADGLVKGSVRYALGAESYAAEGGVLPANSLEWNKDAEAVTAQYADERGRETLTLLLYPTPEIAGAIAKSIEGGMAGMGPQFGAAKVRREGEMVVLASGSFSAEQAQRMVDTVHLKQQVSIDKAMGPTFHAQVQTTVSLLKNIVILSGILMLASILLAAFLGGGRALVRVMRGKPATGESEFLSLHLAAQNKPARFDQQD
jgi:hypothetical protein